MEIEIRELREELAALRGSSSESAGTRKEGDRIAASRYESYEAEVQGLTEQLEAIRQSESFRVGHTLVQALRPLTALRERKRERSSALDVGETSDLASRKSTRFPIPEGRDLLGPLNDNHSTTMFVVWGHSPEELESLTDEVARLQLMLRDFKPLFVTDSESWSAFQRHGYWFEYIPSAREWSDHLQITAWPTYVSRRIDSIIATYAPDRIVVYDRGKERDALRSGVLNQIVTTRKADREGPKLAPRVR